MTGRFQGHDPARGTDTGGTPWAGRTLTGTGFDQDTGVPDPVLADLLARPDADPEELVAAVAAARLIVPVVAVPGESTVVDGLAADATSDMASVTLVAPDGAKALPAFTGTAALSAWNDRARPVPVTAQRAALAAVQEGCDVIPLDLPAPPGPARWTLRPSMVWALAMGRRWVPAHQDEHVEAAVADQAARHTEVTGHALAGRADGALEVTLALRPGLTRDQVQRVLTAVGQALAGDGETRARIDAVAFRVTTG